MHDLQNEKLVGKSIGLAADCLDFRDLHEVGGSDSILSTFAVIDHQRQERDKKTRNSSVDAVVPLVRPGKSTADGHKI